jgi:hypothetical protein
MLVTIRIYECFNEYDRINTFKTIQFDLSSDLYSLNQTERSKYLMTMQVSLKKVKSLMLKIISKMSIKYTRFLSSFNLRYPTVDIKLWTVKFGDSISFPITLFSESGIQSFYLPPNLFKELPDSNNGSQYSLVTYCRLDWKLSILTVDASTLKQMRGETTSLNVFLHDKNVPISGLKNSRIIFSMTDKVLRKVNSR